MGQTLTHGVYLPDEGERNCYSGLAANWQILDSSVGTIAEHTSALSGKAPLVHTHTKSDITDFPAYGTTAGTICEGNDSRLSDARTPVAHTHLTSDVTDLLNENHAWTANQNLKNTAITNHKANPSADTGIAWYFLDNNNKYWGSISHNYFTTGVSEVQIAMSNWATSGSQGYWHLDFGATKDFSNVYFQPSSNNNINLGTSTNQWNNLYAKNYYYNGVAWGLDKANVWSGANTFRQNITYERTNFFHQAANPCYFLKDTDLEKGSLASTVHSAYTGNWQDKNGVNLGYVRFVEYATGKQTAEIRVSNLIKNGALDPTGSTVNCTVNLELQPSGEKSLIPEQNNDINLGTSTNKWKSLNGINPGALSLPGVGGYTDIKGDITNLSGGDNTFTALYDGWVCIKSTNATIIHIINTTWAVSQSATRSTAGTLCCLCPVMSGQSFRVIVNATSLEYAYIHPCKGNV